MARMYSRKKGKSGSKKPMEKIAPWVSYSPQEIEEIIVKHANKDMQSAKIGLFLRDKYGIPSARLQTGKKIAKTLKERNIYPKLPEDLLNLLKQTVNLYDHMKNNKKDYTSKRGLEIAESKRRKLSYYYRKTKALPPTWKYNADEARLLVKG